MSVMNWLQDAGDGQALAKMLEAAVGAARRRQRVCWLSLPSARNYVLRRLAAAGALLGAEALHFQQLHMRILAQVGVRAEFVSSGMRVARVGEALRDVLGGAPLPGEARLFARAIAELKRFEVTPQALPVVDDEAERLRRVYDRYERLKGERLDPDDAARLAADMVAAGRWRAQADVVFAAGFWELSPLAISLLSAMEKTGLEVWASLPEPPLEASSAAPREVVPRVGRASNPVHEVRWVLAEIKRGVLQGRFEPLQTALVVPTERLEAVKMLAREYELYLMDETYRRPSEDEAGKLLVDLLRFPDHPTPEGLFLFKELAPLGRAALARGLAGLDAIEKLAEMLDAQEGGAYAQELAATLRRLDPLANLNDQEDAPKRLLAWAEELLRSRPALNDSPWRDVFLLRAREALEAGGPAGFRQWWAGLLERVRSRRRSQGGVALLSPREISGRHYEHAFVIGASEGVYTLADREDYFVPEDERYSWKEVFERVYGERGLLPRRLRGRDVMLWRSLRGIADEVVITYPEADAGQPLKPERDLVQGGETFTLGPVELLSRALSSEGEGYRSPPSDETPLPPPRGLSDVWRYSNSFGRCGFRSWLQAQRDLKPAEETEEGGWYYWFRKLRDAKASGMEPDSEALARLGMSRAVWENLNFFPQAKLAGLDVPVSVHAGARQGRTARIYRFGDAALDVKEVRKKIREGWGELLMARYFLERSYAVELYYWPLGGPPLLAYSLDPQKDRPEWREAFEKMTKKAFEKAREALRDYLRAKASVRPGWHCRNCPFADVCRKGEGR